MCILSRKLITGHLITANRRACFSSNSQTRILARIPIANYSTTPAEIWRLPFHPLEVQFNEVQICKVLDRKLYIVTYDS